MKAKLFLLAVLAVALFLSPLEQDSLRAQEAIDVRGRVVNGTEGAETLEGLNVLMLVTAADGRLAATGQAEPDAQGRFVFKNVLGNGNSDGSGPDPDLSRELSVRYSEEF